MWICCYSNILFQPVKRVCSVDLLIQLKPDKHVHFMCISRQLKMSDVAGNEIPNDWFYIVILILRQAGLHALPFLAQDWCDNDHPCRGACGYRDLLSADPVRWHLGGMEEQTLRGGGGHRPQ